MDSSFEGPPVGISPTSLHYMCLPDTATVSALVDQTWAVGLPT